MAHGAPDYSNVRKEEFVYRVDDMAELSARLNKSVSLERRGETVLFEDFAEGFNAWDATIFGTGSAVNLTADEFVSKGFAAEIIAGSDGAKQAKLDYELPLLSISKIGLEARIKQFANLDDIAIQIDLYDGTNLYTGRLRYSPNDEKITIKTPDDNDDVVQTSVTKPPDGELFGFMKVVLDTSNNMYVRGFYNNIQLDLSDYSLYTIASATAPRMVIQLLVNGLGTTTAKAVYDNIIVTRNES